MNGADPIAAAAEITMAVMAGRGAPPAPVADLLAGAEPLPDQSEITLEEARARYPGCHIVALRYGAPIEPDWPDGFWCLLAVPERKLLEVVAKSLPGPIGGFAELRPTSIRITPPA